jgi:hypothetical protein
MMNGAGNMNGLPSDPSELPPPEFSDAATDVPAPMAPRDDEEPR